MKALTFLFLMPLFFIHNAFAGSSNEAKIVLKDSISKIDNYTSYQYKFTLSADVQSNYSGMSLREIDLVKGFGCVRKKDGITKSYQKSNGSEKTLFQGKWTDVKKSEGFIINNGNNIYSYSTTQYPTMWRYSDIGSISTNFRIIYKAICNKDALYLGKQKINTKLCHIIKTSINEFSNLIVGIEAPINIAIDINTGFPIKIWGNIKRSKASIDFTEHKINPILEDSLFVPPNTMKFEMVNGLEKQFGNYIPECDP